MRWRLLPLPAFRPVVIPDGHVYCSACSSWRAVDVIPAVLSLEIPAFPCCVFCGSLIDLEEEPA